MVPIAGKSYAKPAKLVSFARAVLVDLHRHLVVIFGEYYQVIIDERADHGFGLVKHRVP